jgi:hypothetical protein
MDRLIAVVTFLIAFVVASTATWVVNRRRKMARH